ncbi:MAG: SsrA-binding protein SmpB [bacterium]|nr:SsrA-binding protein SmpB [bacterium]
MKVTVNKKAFHDYFILEKYIAGIVLLGCEVKSIRAGRINLKDSHVKFKSSEAFLVNTHIAKYDKNYFHEHYDETRSRKLLLHKRESKKLQEKVATQGVSIVPLKVFFSKHNFVKIEIAVVKGKKLYDKKQVKKEADIKRQTEQELKGY